MNRTIPYETLRIDAGLLLARSEGSLRSADLENWLADLTAALTAVAS